VRVGNIEGKEYMAWVEAMQDKFNDPEVGCVSGSAMLPLYYLVDQTLSPDALLVLLVAYLSTSTPDVYNGECSLEDLVFLTHLPAEDIARAVSELNRSGLVPFKVVLAENGR